MSDFLKPDQNLTIDAIRKYVAHGEDKRQQIIDMLMASPIVIRAEEFGILITGDEIVNLLLPPVFLEPVATCGCDRCAQFPDFEQTFEDKYLKMRLGCKCYGRVQIKAYDEFVFSKVSGEQLCHEMKVELFANWNEWAESRHELNALYQNS